MTGWPEGSMWFVCTGTAEWNAIERRWEGKVKVYGHGIHIAELIVYGRSSCINAVIGKYRSGQYICISDIDAGCLLSSFQMYAGIKSACLAHMQEADAVTVTYALRALSKYLGTDWL